MLSRLSIIKSFFGSNVASFRELKNQSLSMDLQSMRKQLIYRACKLGMRELDLVVGEWAKINVPQLSANECNQFHKEVLSVETPELFKYVLGTEPDPTNSRYIRLIKDFAYDGTPKNTEL